MNTTFPNQSDIGVRHLTLLPTSPTFPPQPPTNNHRTRWPVPKPVWTVSYFHEGWITEILVTANECKRDSANPRVAVADGVEINVGGRITDITK